MLLASSYKFESKKQQRCWSKMFQNSKNHEKGVFSLSRANITDFYMMIKAPLVTIFDDFQQSRAKFKNRMQGEFSQISNFFL